MPRCPVCGLPTAQEILIRYAGVCRRCHTRRRYVPQPYAGGHTTYFMPGYAQWVADCSRDPS